MLVRRSLSLLFLALSRANDLEDLVRLEVQPLPESEHPERPARGGAAAPPPPASRCANSSGVVVVALVNVAHATDDDALGAARPLPSGVAAEASLTPRGLAQARERKRENVPRRMCIYIPIYV